MVRLRGSAGRAPLCCPRPPPPDFLGSSHPGSSQCPGGESRKTLSISRPPPTSAPHAPRSPTPTGSIPEEGPAKGNHVGTRRGLSILVQDPGRAAPGQKCQLPNHRPTSPATPISALCGAEDGLMINRRRGS